MDPDGNYIPDGSDIQGNKIFWIQPLEKLNKRIGFADFAFFMHGKIFVHALKHNVKHIIIIQQLKKFFVFYSKGKNCRENIRVAAVNNFEIFKCWKIKT